MGALAPWGWIFPVVFQIELLAAAGQWVPLALYAAVVVACFAGLLMVPFLSGWKARTFFTSVLLAGFFADQVMVAVSGEHITLDLMRTLWRERAMAGDALSAYGATVTNKGILTAFLGLAFLLPPPARRRVGIRFGTVPVAALAGVALVMQSTREGIEAFPAPYSAPAQLAIAAFLPDTDAPVPRSPVPYDTPPRRGVQKIVMIVDESVRGDMLGINNPEFDNTPALRDASDLIANYGVALAAANCSAASRLILRVGLQSHQLPDRQGLWRRTPTIWQYAASAGYRTVLVDTWNRLHSHMDQQEAATIDDLITVSDVPGYERDRVVADRVIALLEESGPLFLYVNKAGTHPPYSRWFPPDSSYDPTVVARNPPSDDSRRRTLRDYHKALRWSVDGFFARLLPTLRQRDDVVVIYTSDHGQSLYEGGYEVSHCSVRPDVAPGELWVPLFVIARVPELADAFASEARRAFNRADHFEVFPTLLELMGYPRDWIGKQYGPGLLDVPVQRTRGFLLGSFLNPHASWMREDVTARRISNLSGFGS